MKSKVREVDSLIVEIRERNEREYGNPSIPSCVKVEVDLYATKHKLAKRDALAELTKEYGTYEYLESKLLKSSQRRRKKEEKRKAVADDIAKSNPKEVSSYTKILEASKIRKFNPISLGGAPGLGKKS